jgi:hypothetical protein
MTHESIPNDDWQRTVERLGGEALLETEAREFGAFERVRKFGARAIICGWFWPIAGACAGCD